MISPDIIAFIIPLLKNILTFINSLHPIFMFGIFAVFVFIAVKTFQTFIKAIYIAIAGIAFPFVMNYILGINMPTDLNTLIFFATAGIGLFFAYHVLRLIYKTVSKLAWVGGKLGGKSKKKSKQDLTAPSLPIISKIPKAVEELEESVEEDLEEK